MRSERTVLIRTANKIRARTQKSTELPLTDIESYLRVLTVCNV